jgi:hypothetical protein
MLSAPTTLVRGREGNTKKTSPLAAAALAVTVFTGAPTVACVAFETRAAMQENIETPPSENVEPAQSVQVDQK